MKEPVLDRREFMKLGGSLVLTSISGIDALGQSLAKKPELAREILDIRKELSPGGRYHFAIYKSELTDSMLAEIADRAEGISKELREMHHKLKPIDKEVGQYIVSQQLPGLMRIQLPTGQYANIGGTRQPVLYDCNAFALHARGRTREMTAAHCVRGTLKESEYIMPRDPTVDVATRDITGTYKGPALVFDGHTTREALSGAIGITIGEKSGIADAFYSPLIPVTAQTVDLMFSGMVLPDADVRQMKRGFWKILPKEQGRDSRGNIVAKGRSGSIEIAYEPRRRGYTPVGIFTMVGVLTTGPLAGKVVGFISGPDSIDELLDDAAVGRFAKEKLRSR